MNEQEFCALMARLQRQARRLTANEEDAADLAQEAGLKLWQRLERAPAPDNTEAYSMTMLRNLARSRWRMRRPTETFDETMVAIEPDAPRRIACKEVEEAMARLPPAQARLMARVAGGETSPAELAQSTGLPIGTVMSRLARARARLRRDLGMAPGTPTVALYEEHGDKV